jgi:hypothetical protein
MNYEDHERAASVHNMQESLRITNRILEENRRRKQQDREQRTLPTVQTLRTVRTVRTAQTEKDSTDRAFAYTIEAARALCGGEPGRARELLNLALEGIRSAMKAGAKNSYHS